MPCMLRPKIIKDYIHVNDFAFPSSSLCRPPRLSRLRPGPRVRLERAPQPDDRCAVPLTVPKDAQLDAGVQEWNVVKDTQMCSRYVLFSREQLSNDVNTCNVVQYNT
jgi:hypothetical protein